MNAAKNKQRLRLMSMIAIALCFSLVLSLLLPFSTNTVDAKKTDRAAIVISLKGTVTVKKAGGKKDYDVYKKMILNQGDQISTGKGSSVVLQIDDVDDEITIGEKSKVYISDLKDKEGKKTGFKLWAGSLWSKVKSLVSGEDEFEVETPTAVMGVRGTQFFTSVNPETGNTKVVVGAGVVQAKTPTSNNPSGEVTAAGNERTISLLPSQSLDIINSDEFTFPASTVSIIDISQLVGSASPAIIEAIIRNKQALDEENKQFIEEQRRLLEQGSDDQDEEDGGNDQGEEGGGLGIGSLEDLDRVMGNLDNFVGNIVKTAIEMNVVNEEEIKKVIEEVNQKTDKKLDLDNVKPMALTEQEKKKQDELKALREQQNKELEAKKQREAELAKQNAELLKKLEEERKRQAEANQAAAQKKKEEAERKFREQLSAQEKQRFDQEKQQREEEKQSQSTPPSTPTEPTTPTEPPETTPDPVIPTPVPPAATVMLNGAPATGSAVSVAPDGELALDIRLSNITSPFYALELHIVYDTNLYVRDGVEFNPDGIFGEDSAMTFKESTGLDDGVVRREVTYVVSNFGDVNSSPIGSAGKSVMRITFKPEQAVTSNLSGIIKIAGLSVVDSTGKVVYEITNAQSQTVNYQIQSGQ